MRSLWVIAIVLVAATPARAGGRAEDGEPVHVAVDSADVRYLSPPGHEAVLEVSPEFEPRDAAIESLSFSVYGASAPLVGALVYRRDYRRGPFGIRLPAAFVWDATFLSSPVGEDGEPVPDGDYSYEIAVVGPGGRPSRTPPLPVVVDSRPPVISSVTAEYEVFSPTGDGYRDSVRISQRGSQEERWVGRIRNAAHLVVREFTAYRSVPPDIEWDGRSDDGVVVPDGRYEYVLAGTDRAGNRSESDPVPLIVHTRTDGVRLSPHATVAPVSAAGEIAPVRYDVTVSGLADVVSWRFEAAAASGPPGRRPYVSREGEGPPPDQIVLSGRDPDGHELAEGEYEITLTVEYGSGVRVRSPPVPYVVDRTAPHGRLVAQTMPSPSGDAEDLVFGGAGREAIEFSAAVSNDLWILHISHEGRTERLPLRHLGVNGMQLSYIWDGTDLSGRRMPDGRYVIGLHGTDRAGNVGATNEVQVVKDTRTSFAALAVSPQRFSPFADDAPRSVVLTPRAAPQDGISSTLLEIMDREGRVVRRWRDADAGPLEWSGRTDAGAMAPDGTYTARLEVQHANGDRSVATAGPIVVDTQPPAVHQLDAAYRVLRPTDDGYRDTVRILQWTSSARWTGRIVDAQGRLVIERRWSGLAEDFTWDGRDESGSVVADGEYAYELVGRDEVGNVARARLFLIVDTTSLPAFRRPPRLSIAAVPRLFVPSVDRDARPLTLSLEASGPNEIASWLVEISDATGDPVRAFRGDGVPPLELEWDGRYSDGRLVQSASAYRAAFVATDVYGNTSEAAVRVTTGVLVVRDGILPRMMVPGIVFQATSADLLAADEGSRRRNLDTLRTVAEVLRRSPEHEILLEGHASSDEYEDPRWTDARRREQLTTLSSMRAEGVRRALVLLGVEPERMSVIGYGDARPVVPREDHENRWQNRRVEFILK